MSCVDCMGPMRLERDYEGKEGTRGERLEIWWQGRGTRQQTVGFRFLGRKWAWLQARTRGGDDEEEVSKLFFLDESFHLNNYIRLQHGPSRGIIIYNQSLITPQHHRFLAAASKKSLTRSLESRVSFFFAASHRSQNDGIS